MYRSEYISPERCPDCKHQWVLHGSARKKEDKRHCHVQVEKNGIYLTCHCKKSFEENFLED